MYDVLIEVANIEVGVDPKYLLSALLQVGSEPTPLLVSSLKLLRLASGLDQLQWCVNGYD